LPGGYNEIQVIRVGANGGHQRFCPLHPRFHQDFIVRDIRRMFTMIGKSGPLITSI